MTSVGKMESAGGGSVAKMGEDWEDCKTTLDKWIYILKNMETMEALPHTFAKGPVFRRLGKVARFAALNEKDKKAYKESHIGGHKREARGALGERKVHAGET